MPNTAVSYIIQYSVHSLLSTFTLSKIKLKHYWKICMNRWNKKKGKAWKMFLQSAYKVSARNMALHT